MQSLCIIQTNATTFNCFNRFIVLTPESLYYWKLKKTLTTLLSSDDDDPVTETPIRERQTKIEMKLEMVGYKLFHYFRII